MSDMSDKTDKPDRATLAAHLLEVLDSIDHLNPTDLRNFGRVLGMMMVACTHRAKALEANRPYVAATELATYANAYASVREKLLLYLPLNQSEDI